MTRPTIYQTLLVRHGTCRQAEFFLATRGQSMAEVENGHRRAQGALARVEQAIPLEWRRARVMRGDLDRFLFEPGDLVVAVGQDGLVANLAKYLDGQAVIGINPDPGSYDGVLCPHLPEQIDDLLRAASSRRSRHSGDPQNSRSARNWRNCGIQERTMVEASTDDGQRLLALNEVFIGQRAHQSARYRITWRGAGERHSSSGLIAATGTGATGWARSVHRQRKTDVVLPDPCERRVAFFVREAFPSVATGTDVTDGDLSSDEELEVISEMNEGGVIFGDGIEADRIDFHYGMRLSVRVARTRLCLVTSGHRR